MISQLEKRKKMEEEIRLAISHIIPDSFYLSKAAYDGDCFMSAVASALNQLKQSNIVTVKSLRMLCHENMKHSWWYQSIVLNNLHPNVGDPDFKCYCDYIQYTSDEMKKKDMTVAEKFKVGIAVTSRPDREGLLFSSKFKVIIHVIRIDAKQNNTTTEFLIKESGCEKIERMPPEIYRKKNMIHIANYSGIYWSHAMPILSKIT